MVKTLHPIGEISASISLASDRLVRLERQENTVAIENGTIHVATPRGETPALDAVSAVVRALADPLDFPPLAAATVPGDRVAIALDDNVPCAASVVDGAVQAFQNAGVDPDAIAIVTTDAESARLCREGFGDDTANSPHFVVHDPENNANLCLVGVTKRGEPLLVNRTIFDADVVLPIGCARLDNCGVYSSLFPRFSNAAAIERYQTPGNLGSTGDADHRLREMNEAGWLIGVPMVVQVVPGPGETIAHVVAGEPNAVAQRADQLCRARWLLNIPQQVSLVIATITGGAQAQRWENVGRALATAEHLVVDGGAVAICSNLEQAPGQSLGRLIGSTDLAKTERKILHDHNEDSWPAWQLAGALQRGPVYFLSQLDSETVEDLGIAPIADIAELVRLAGRHESCIVIEDSQHAVVAVDGTNYES